MPRQKTKNATNTTMKVSRADLVRWRKIAASKGVSLREAIDEGLALLHADRDRDAKLGRDVRARVAEEIIERIDAGVTS